MQPQGTPENGYLWQRVNSQLSSPSQPYSLREALAQAQSSRIGASTQALRESLHPILRQKLVRCLLQIVYSITCNGSISFFLMMMMRSINLSTLVLLDIIIISDASVLFRNFGKRTLVLLSVFKFWK